MLKIATQRPYIEKDGILIFDSALDQRFSSYDSKYLDEIAKIESHHFWFMARREKICSLFAKHVEKNERILEIGAGTGFIAEKLQEHGYAIEVSDCYSNGLFFARDRGIKRLYQFDLFDPPFQELFDVICLFDVLEHLKESQLAVSKIKQMLKPGGKIILTVPAHMFLWSRDDALAGHQIRYNKKSLNDLFCSCGLHLLYAQYFFTLIFPFLYLRKWIKPDSGNPIQLNEKFQFQIPKFLNKPFYFLTKFEFFLEKWISHFIGGSLIAVAQKEKSCI